MSLTERRARTSSAGDYRFLVFSCLVVVSNNGLLFLQPNAPRPVFAGKVLLWAAILGWTIWIERLSLQDLGLRVEGAWRSAGYGAIAGLGMAAPALLFLAFPLILRQPVRSTAFAVPESSPVAALLVLIFLVNTAVIFEEFLFRGVFQERGARWLGPIGGIALSCALFVLWHVISAYQGIQATNLWSASIPWLILYVAAGVPIAVAGVVLSLLRYRTANLAGSIVAHWLVVSLLQGLLLITSTHAAGA